MVGQTLLHCLKCLLGIDHPVTQTTADEQTSMLKYLKRSKLIAEIGVFEGYNTREFALNSSEEARVYAIDPFMKGALGVSYGKLIAYDTWKKNGVIDKIKVLNDLSWNVHSSLNEMFDFIFIDGDHSFEGVKKDFELYSQNLSEKGTIAFHDARIFNGGWTSENWGPVQLIEKIIKPNNQWKIVEEVDSTVFIQRSGI